MTCKSLVMTSGLFAVSLVINMTYVSLVTFHWVPSCREGVMGGPILPSFLKKFSRGEQRNTPFNNASSLNIFPPSDGFFFECDSAEEA